jgi:DNA-binding MurR/RpiR family transcriptional regulator
MATAIAETIAARTASLNVSTATASRFSQTLSAAS